MSNKDPLKEILEKKYAEVKSDAVDKTPEQFEGETIYVPHTVGKDDYILKLEYVAPIDAGYLVSSKASAKVAGVAKLRQKIIAARNIDHQKSLKYYYESVTRTEKK